MPALMGWAFFISGGGRGIYGWGADGRAGGGFNFGESYGFKALHFENINRR